MKVAMVVEAETGMGTGLTGAAGATMDSGIETVTTVGVRTGTEEGVTRDPGAPWDRGHRGWGVAGMSTTH